MSTSFRSVEGKIALVTGAARGLGRGIAETFADEGIKIVIQDFNQDVKNTFDEIKKKDIPNVEMKILSMGMSNSYMVAIEEGANMVRIGTKLFGPRPER